MFLNCKTKDHVLFCMLVPIVDMYLGRLAFAAEQGEDTDKERETTYPQAGGYEAAVTPNRPRLPRGRKASTFPFSAITHSSAPLR
jgi:hypothetical protein